MNSPMQASSDPRDKFNRLYYASNVWMHTSWHGVPVAKTPTDLWIYQEIIHEHRPDWIVETGSWMGGSALYLAHQLDHFGGRVISVDIDVRERPKHPLITWLHADSGRQETAESVRAEVSGKVMVILDSDHTKPHVLKELEYLAPLVTPGQYLIVEDTNLNGVVPWTEPGPAEALASWLQDKPDRWEEDAGREKFLLTFNPGGYLKRRG